MPFSTTYDLYPAQFIEGQIVDSFPHDIITLANSAAQVKQVDTLTVGTVAVGTTYRYTAFGQTVTYTSTGADTLAGITAGLIAAIRANGTIYGRLNPTSTVAGTIVLTSHLAGVANAFTSAVSGGGAGYAVVNTTPAADPVVLPFGRAVATLATDGHKTGRLPNAAPSATNIIRGVCIRTHAYESRGIGATIEEGYAPREPMNLMKRGRVAVRVLDAVTPLSQVFVVTSGVHAGKFRGSADAAASPLTPAAGTTNGGWAFVSATPAGGLAILNISLP